MARQLREFPCEERGGGNDRVRLWLPIIVSLLVIAIDATTLYVTHTEMWNVARDTAWRMVTGKIRTEVDAEAYALNAMSLREVPYTVEAFYDQNSIVELRISISFSDLSVMGYGSALTIFGREMTAHVVVRPDPRIPFQAGA